MVAIAAAKARACRRAPPEDHLSSHSHSTVVEAEWPVAGMAACCNSGVTTLEDVDINNRAL